MLDCFSLVVDNKGATVDSGAKDTAAPVSTSMRRDWLFTCNSAKYSCDNVGSLMMNKGASCVGGVGSVQSTADSQAEDVLEADSHLVFLP